MGRPTSGWPEGGSNRKWRRIRARRLQMDGHVCQLRFDGCTFIADTVHHLGGRANIGDDDINLLRAACMSCNIKAEKRPAQDPPARPSTIL